MSPLQARLHEISRGFADAVLEAVRGSSLQDLYSANEGRQTANRRSGPKAIPSAAAIASEKPARRTGRLPRRSADDIGRTLGQLIAVVKKNPEGLRAEQIRHELGLQAKEMPRILKEGLSTKKLRSKGQKRATTYFAK